MSDTSDGANFRKMYRELEPLVRAVVYQIAGPSLLDDLVQDAFIKIWRGRFSFQGQSALRSWAYRIAANTAIDSLRSGQRRYEKLGHDVSAVPDETPSAARKLEARDLVQRGLATLTEDHRAIAVLALIHDRPLEEIADILELPLGTVKSRLHYAKENLKTYFEGNNI